MKIQCSNPRLSKAGLHEHSLLQREIPRARDGSDCLELQLPPLHGPNTRAFLEQHIALGVLAGLIEKRIDALFCVKKYIYVEIYTPYSFYVHVCVCLRSMRGSGVYPEVDPFGARFSAIHNPERWRMAGTRIAGQYVAVLEGIQADQDFVRVVLRPDRAALAFMLLHRHRCCKLQVVCSMA